MAERSYIKQIANSNLLGVDDEIDPEFDLSANLVKNSSTTYAKIKKKMDTTYQLQKLVKGKMNCAALQSDTEDQSARTDIFKFLRNKSQVTIATRINGDQAEASDNYFQFQSDKANLESDSESSEEEEESSDEEVHRQAIANMSIKDLEREAYLSKKAAEIAFSQKNSAKGLEKQRNDQSAVEKKVTDEKSVKKFTGTKPQGHPDASSKFSSSILKKLAKLKIGAKTIPPKRKDGNYSLLGHNIEVPGALKHKVLGKKVVSTPVSTTTYPNSTDLDSDPDSESYSSELTMNDKLNDGEKCTQKESENSSMNEATSLALLNNSVISKTLSNVEHVESEDTSSNVSSVVLVIDEDYSETDNNVEQNGKEECEDITSSD